jgi:hypothetical protein
MSDKKNKYSKISEWIEDHYSKLFDIMCNLSIEKSVDTNKIYSEITFLMPDKSLMSIIEQMYSEDFEKTINLIISLVVPIYIGTIDDFVKASKNKTLGNKHKYLFPPIKDFNGKEVVFDNGMIITQASHKFKANKLAIWKISGTFPPNDTDDSVKETFTINIKRNDSSSKRSIRDEHDDSRKIFAINIEKKADVIGTQAYLYAVVMLINAISKKKNVLNNIFPIIDIDPIITFYLLIEPYKTSDFLVSSSIFTPKLLNNITNYTGTVRNKEYLNILNSEQLNDSNIYSKTPELVEVINYIREYLLESTDIDIDKQVIKLYNTLEKNNEIVYLDKYIDNIYPSDLFEHLKINTNKKLWQDQFRFFVSEFIRNVLLKQQTYMSLGRYIMDNFSGNYTDELLLFSSNKCVYDKSYTKMTKYFINSPNFLYMSVNESNLPLVKSPLNTPGYDRIERSLNIHNKSSKMSKSFHSKIKKIVDDNELESDSASD